MTRKIDMIAVHCDANGNSKWGLKELDIFHRSEGYGGIGYHFWIDFEGKVYKTRPLSVKGCHVFDHNANSIGICLHGHSVFYIPQFKSLTTLLVEICKKYKLDTDRIFPHNYFTKIKPCPNFDLTPIKSEVSKLLQESFK